MINEQVGTEILELGFTELGDDGLEVMITSGNEEVQETDGKITVWKKEGGKEVFLARDNGTIEEFDTVKESLLFLKSMNLSDDDIMELELKRDRFMVVPLTPYIIADLTTNQMH